jgi:hypothetical protein
MDWGAPGTVSGIPYTGPESEVGCVLDCPQCTTRVSRWVRDRCGDADQGTGAVTF